MKIALSFGWLSGLFSISCENNNLVQCCLKISQHSCDTVRSAIVLVYFYVITQFRDSYDGLGLNSRSILVLYS